MSTISPPQPPSLREGGALYDALTGLPGAVLLYDRLQIAIATAMHQARGLAVLVVELERLSLVEDSFGPSTREKVVQQTASCLRSATRADETLAYLDDGRFALVLSGFANAQQIVTRAQALLAQITRTQSVNGHRLAVAAGIGVAVFPRDATVPDELLRAAIGAVEVARSADENVVRYHAADMEARSALRLDVESRLRRAMTRSELSLDYQPKVSLATSLVSGAEALLRWSDAERGAIAPKEFIPVAEETDLILGLGSWVIRRACSMLRERTRLGYPELPVSVNVSARQFLEQDVPGLVRDVLDETGVDPRLLHLEVTEAVFLQDNGRATHLASALKDMGVRLALDDFGTGYFCLRDLKSLPLDYLKVDSSFIRGMRGDDRDQAIVEAIVRMSHRLGFRVIAEGVETEWEAGRLRDMGCDEAQGYLFRRPMPEEQFACLVTAPVSRRGSAVERSLLRSA